MPQLNCRLKHANGTQRTPTAIPETKGKKPQESNTCADTTDTQHYGAAAQKNTSNDSLEAIHLLRLELMDMKLAMNIS